MRATGIVRRIDDLGRVAIPREIRRTMRIREGDPLEIFTDTREGTVCFKKYSPMGDSADIIEIAEKMLKKYGVKAAIYDRDDKLAGSRDWPPRADDEWADSIQTRTVADNGLNYEVKTIYVQGEVYGYITYKAGSDVEGVIAAARLIEIAMDN